MGLRVAIHYWCTASRSTDPLRDPKGPPVGLSPYDPPYAFLANQFEVVWLVRNRPIPIVLSGVFHASGRHSMRAAHLNHSGV
jgi:hypothetical protein